MFSIYENNKKICGSCRSFVLCLDYVAISPFICFNEALKGETGSLNGMIINNVRFADDTVLLASKNEDLPTLINKMNENCTDYGMS